MTVDVRIVDHVSGRWYSPMTGVFYPEGPPEFDRDTLVAGVDMPNTSTTGVLPGVERTNYGGSVSSLPSGTYENLNFTTGDVTLVNGRTYVFRNCMFNAAGDSCDALVKAYGSGTWSAKFYDCTFRPTWSAHTDTLSGNGHGTTSADGIKGHHFELYRCYLTACIDGVFIFNTAATNADSGVIVQQCLIDGAAFWRPQGSSRPEGTHNDGVAINSGNNTVLLGNRIDWFNDPTVGDAQFSEYTGSDGNLHGLEAVNDPEQWANGDAIFVRRSVGPIDKLVIDRNWLTGGQVQIRISGSSGTITDLTMTDNVCGDTGTIDDGSANTNISLDTASQTDALDISGNVQFSGGAATVFNT